MLDVFIGFAVLLGTLFFIAGKRLKDFGILLLAAVILFATGLIILDTGWETQNNAQITITDFNATTTIIDFGTTLFPATLEANPIIFAFATALLAAGFVLALHALSLSQERKMIKELSQDTPD